MIILYTEAQYSSHFDLLGRRLKASKGITVKFLVHALVAQTGVCAGS